MADPLSERPGAFSPTVLRRLVVVVLPVAILAGSVVLALYYQDRANEERLHEQAGLYLVDLNAAIITREIESVESDLLYLAGQAALRHFLADRPGAAKELEEEYLLFCRQRAAYDQIRYLDAEGRERIRINFNDGRPAVVAASDLQPKANRYYFVEAMRLGSGEVFVSPFDLNVEHGEIERPLKPTIRVATPIVDGAGTKRGVLVLNYLGAALLRKLAEVAHSFPGTALLLNQEGYFLRGPQPEREWGFMLGHGHTFGKDDGAAWSCIREQRDGHCRTDDGLVTFRTLIPHRPGNEKTPGDASLIVVAHTSPEVLYARSDQLLRRLLLLYLVLVLVLLPLAWYLAYVGSLRQAHERRLEDSEGRLRRLSTKLIATQEEERRGISRDMHDELGQVVTSIVLDLQRAGQAADLEKKNEIIGRALHGADHLLERVHEIGARVRPPILDDLGLKDAVQSLLSEYEQRTGIVPRLDLRCAPDAVSPAVSASVYRILQEALTNVARHAKASEVVVRLHADSGAVALTVRDNGVGFDPATVDGKRLGILGMRERAELLGGTFVLSAEAKVGTEIQVVIPTGSRAE